jgi:multiple sugar transport system substrate-binding protein
MTDRTSVIKQVAAKGLAGGSFLIAALKASQPAFLPAPPVAYPEFSEAVYTNLHEAAAGTESVAGAMKAIAAVTGQIAAQGD